MEALVGRYQVQVQSLNRSQEFRIFHESVKVKYETSLLDTLSVEIQLYFKACAGDKNGEDR